jgi:PadR family transcriptional regulator PadR
MLILRGLAARPMYGYAIAQRIRSLSGDVLHVKEGSLYPALQKLRRKGWVEAYPAVSKTNRRVFMYRLTRNGQKGMRSELSAYRRITRAIARVIEEPGGARP